MKNLNINNISIILQFAYQSHMYFGLASQQNLVTILINTIFRSAGQREKVISIWIPKGAAVIRRRRLYEAQRLSEEKRHCPGWDPLCAKCMTFSCKECARIILSCFDKVPLFKTVISEIICLYGVRCGSDVRCKMCSTLNYMS